MRSIFVLRVVILFFSFLAGTLHTYGQNEAQENIDNAATLLEGRTQSLSKYLERSNGIQQRLLKRLQRREERMLKKLAAKDSALYYQYIQQQRFGYDSIAKLSTDTTYQNKLASQKNTTIDSLKGLQSFIASEQGKLGSVNAVAGKANIATPKELGSLQSRLNAQQAVDQLIQQKTASLKDFAASHTNIKGLEGIQKDVYYAREKIKSWRKLAEEPDDAEAKAMEYLQGTEGFDKFLQPKNTAFGGLGNNATAEDLQRMGYQTKGQVNAMLQKSLGNNISTVQQQIGQQVQQYTEKLNEIARPLNEVKGGIADAKQGLQSAKDGLSQTLSKGEGFKINPERGKPFWQRLEWRYNFQTGRSSVDGLKPAMLDLGASVGYKQNERLSFGIGLATSFGLGRNWQNIKFSYEGITARAYADWKWIYGFSFQAGYERSFRPANRNYLNSKSQDQNSNPQTDNNENLLKDAFGGQQQAAYLGIMKRYKINSKWNGTFLVGYNFLWQQEGARSPFLLRFGWSK